MVSLVCSEASPSVAAELGGRDFYAPVLRSGYLGSDGGGGWPDGAHSANSGLGRPQLVHALLRALGETAPIGGHRVA